MTKYTTVSLLKTKEEILNSVEEGKLSVKTAAGLLGMTRQGLWKLRKSFKKHGSKALIGRKRGPKFWYRVHNRTPEWVEEKVEDIYILYGGGPDTLLWVIKDYYHDQLGWVKLSRSTIYRILVRRRLLKPKDKKVNLHNRKYAKSYPGEEVQLDTTEPFGKNKGIMLNIIDDYSRWKASYFYPGNNSLNARLFFQHFLASTPFPVQTVRVDNGSEFKKHFQTFCKQKNIRLIRNRINTPQHNGKVERLHRTVEEECLWRVSREQQNSSQAVSYALAQHTLWYNSKRRHLGYKMNKLTPQQKIEDWIINNQPSAEFAKEVNETLILYIN
ncbi:MAG: DDE-type integrase/transposase/recombinase [Patescibacteria group bacterium]